MPNGTGKEMGNSLKYLEYVYQITRPNLKRTNGLRIIADQTKSLKIKLKHKIHFAPSILSPPEKTRLSPACEQFTSLSYL
jgi:hypothetical protein